MSPDDFLCLQSNVHFFFEKDVWSFCTPLNILWRYVYITIDLLERLELEQFNIEISFLIELIRRLMYKREQDRSLGFQAMRRHEFDKARMHFESYLKFSPTDNNEAVTQVLHNLIICRLQGINKQENLTRCVKDCDMLLERSKKQSLPVPYRHSLFFNIDVFDLFFLFICVLFFFLSFSHSDM